MKWELVDQWAAHLSLDVLGPCAARAGEHYIYGNALQSARRRDAFPPTLEARATATAAAANEWNRLLGNKAGRVWWATARNKHRRYDATRSAHRGPQHRTHKPPTSRGARRARARCSQGGTAKLDLPVRRRQH